MANLTGGRCFSFTVSRMKKGSGKLEQLMKPEMWKACRSLFPAPFLSEKAFHTSCPSRIDHRRKRVIVRHLNYIDHEKTLKHNYNPLVTLPDYSYLDGRPTEVMLSQRVREEKNYQLAKHVVQLVDEVKFAQQQLKDQEKATKEYTQQRQKARLKQKDQELD